jgi:hypothetical protein
MDQYCFSATWLACRSLTGESVDNILNSIDASGVIPNSTVVTNSNIITIEYSAFANSYTATAAEANLTAKGWVVQISQIF